MSDTAMNPEAMSMPQSPTFPAAEVAALKASFASALRDPEAFGRRFYERLFLLAPALRSLFPDEIGHQQQKLTQAIIVLLRGLSQPETLEPVLRQLGARHVGYGAKAVHYMLVGEALVTTVDELAEQELDPQSRRAWIKLYGWVAATMLDGSRSVAEAA
jgi:hemoglobin-like flavoprotein